MSTNWSDDLISGYLDQELDPQQQSYVEQEIANDPAKAELLLRMQEQREALHALPKFKLKLDLSDQILEKALVRIREKVDALDSRSGKTKSAERSRKSHVKPVMADKVALTNASSQDSFTSFGLPDWKTAITAAIAMAACLLLTLFTLPVLHPTGSPTVADSSGAENSAEHFGDAPQDGTSEIAANRSKESPSLVDSDTGNRDAEIPSASSSKTSDTDLALKQGSAVTSTEDTANVAEIPNTPELNGSFPNFGGQENSVADGQANQPNRSVEAGNRQNRPDGLANRNENNRYLDRTDEAAIDQIITIKMNPEDIKNQQIASTLKDLNFNLVGDNNLKGSELLFVDTTIASLQILLSRLGGEQQLTIVPARSDIGSSGVDLHPLDQDELIGQPAPKLGDRSNNGSIAGGDPNQGPPSEFRNEDEVPIDSSTAQTKSEIVSNDVPDQGLTNGTVLRMPSFDVKLGGKPSVEFDSDERNIADGDAAKDNSAKNDGVEVPPFIAQQGAGGDAKSGVNEQNENKNFNSPESGIDAGSNDGSAQIYEQPFEPQNILEFAQLDQNAKVRSLIMIIPDESAPRLKFDLDENRDSVVPSLFNQTGDQLEQPSRPGSGKSKAKTDAPSETQSNSNSAGKEDKKN